MIIEVRAKNCYAFEDKITFSMKADMRNKKFGANVHKENNFNVLKTVGIYGPNNAGKTCLIKSRVPAFPKGSVCREFLPRIYGGASCEHRRLQREIQS